MMNRLVDMKYLLQLLGSHFMRKLADEAVECLCRDETIVQQTATHITPTWDANDAVHSERSHSRTRRLTTRVWERVQACSRDHTGSI